MKKSFLRIVTHTAAWFHLTMQGTDWWKIQFSWIKIYSKGILTSSLAFWNLSTQRISYFHPSKFNFSSVVPWIYDLLWVERDKFCCLFAEVVFALLSSWPSSHAWCRIYYNKLLLPYYCHYYTTKLSRRFIFI